jgi:hypothetical protein
MKAETKRSSFASVPGRAWDGSEPEALPSFRAQAEPGREGVGSGQTVLFLSSAAKQALPENKDCFVA